MQNTAWRSRVPPKLALCVSGDSAKEITATAGAAQMIVAIAARMESGCRARLKARVAVLFNRQDPDKRNAPPLTMEVTLVQSKQKQSPKDADYLAQANQSGGGTMREKMRPSSPYANPRPHEARGDAPNTQLATSPAQRQNQKERKLITAERPSDARIASVTSPPLPTLPDAHGHHTH